jgi:hypothetical protein
MYDDKVTASGLPPKEPNNPSVPNSELKENGQYKDYWVLSPEERAKGYVRPVRYSYVHKTCGVCTSMSDALSETYARNPKFYGYTFCVGRKNHFPVSEFLWDGTDEEVGS